MRGAPPRAGSSATRTPGSWCPPGTPTRSPALYAVCTTMRRCGHASGRPRARPCAPTATAHGRPGCPARWPRYGGAAARRAANVAALMRRLILAVVALTLLVAPPAEAWTVNDVIRDCSKNGKLSHDYPPSLIRKARESLPADIDEYTDCRDLLSTPTSSASQGGGGSGGSAGGGGGGTSTSSGGSGGAGGSSPSSASTPEAPAAPPSPAELKTLDAARAGDGGEPVKVGGTPVTPGAAGMTTGAVDNGLPSTLLVVLILLGLTVAVTAGPLLRRRFASGQSPGSLLQRVLPRRQP